MAGKKMEGNEEQRRAAAREAAADGESPSARNETTGASKQRTHLRHGGSVTHEERLATKHRGKQLWRPGDLAEEPVKDPAAEGPERTFAERESHEYTPEHERVFQALTAEQAAHDGEAVFLDDIARRADLPPEETRALLHDLTRVHRLATELVEVDTPDMGPRWEVKPRL
ncbi:hypothetical protein [Streptomyces apricus]|uniref:Uncharacterized protein n=1 Tax=Streptomyces apricus TaxID=1828112 RepID=A0A5B0BKY8_9ACTN|nr:hypothetical protein [Streptomyces apricus]KAA0941962.1 hypothetical protein FGF04_04120 [Streptomyces apricus]